MHMQLNQWRETRRRVKSTEGKKRATVYSGLRTPHSALLWLLCLFAVASELRAQPQTPPDTGLISSNRFLFIVDTSTAMKRHQVDVLNSVHEIITNAATGQMHPGDSLGLWTFNQDVYAQFPLQTWTGVQREETARRMIDFLVHQRYAKTSRLNVALDDMQQIIHASDIITVFIISTGEEKITGTPFNDQINAQYTLALKQMGRDHHPIVTVLQAKGGKIIRFTVNALPWPVIVPELPIQIKFAQPTTPKEIAPVATQAKAQVPPLIIKPSRRPDNPPPVVATTATPPPTPTVKPETAAPVTNAAVPPIPTPPPPTPPLAPAAQPPAVTATTPVLPLPSAPANLRIVPDAPTPPPTTATTNNEFTVSPPQISPPKPLPSSPAPPVHVQSNGATVAAAASASNQPASLSVTKPAMNSVQPVESKTAISPDAAALASNTLSTRALAYVAPETTGRPKMLLIAAMALVVVAIGLIAMMVRRSRSTSGPSIITHSMGNGRKK